MAWPTVVVDTTHLDSATDSPGNARADIKQMADNVNGIKDSRSAANGIAPLDAGGKLPTDNLPTVPANKGGTGQTSYSVGDILYASASGTLTKLSPGTSGHVLTSQGAGNAPVWQAAGGGLTSGTRMSFNQTSAPTGWTKDTTAALNDSIMRIVTGTVGGNGSVGFSAWNTANPSVGDTTLSIAQMPSHTHNASGGTSTTGGSSGLTRGTNGSYQTFATTEQGGGSSHTHAGPGAPSIKYNDFIIASKN